MCGKVLFGLVIALVFVTLFATTARASLSYDISVAYNGPDLEEWPPPWLNATFVEGDLPGEVDLTITTINLSDTEYVRGWYFNLDPTLDPTGLVFSDMVKTGAFDLDISDFDTGDDTFMADGDGDYDILIGFATADGGSLHRFSDGDALQITINHNTADLTPESFDFISAENGGEGEYYTVARVQGISGDDDASSWLTIPEPATMCLLGLGGLALLRKRR